MQKPIIIEAYILKKLAYGNSSWILSVFSASHGRFSVLAKGARKSKKAGLFDYFQRLELTLIKRNDLSLLNNIEIIKSFTLIKDALWLGFYINELCLKLLADNIIDQDLFDSYSSTIERLADHLESEGILRQFEKELLSLLGVFPDFSQDNSGNMINLDKFYLLQDDGFTQYNHDVGTLSTLVFQGQTIYNIYAKQVLSSDEKKAYKRMMRFLIAQELNGKTLYSRQWFEKFKKA